MKKNFDWFPLASLRPSRALIFNAEEIDAVEECLLRMGDANELCDLRLRVVEAMKRLEDNSPLV